MEFLAVEPWKLQALMLAGGIFSLAGLWLMFRTAPEGEAAKVELFGLKFQSSSAGLLVFLIGAAFLVLPLFVPERAAQEAASTGDQTVPSNDTKNSSAGQAAIILPAVANASETEPNETASQANQIEMGAFYKARLNPRRDDVADWFVIDTSDFKSKDISITVRNTSDTGNSFFCSIAVLDKNEEGILWNQGMPKVGSAKTLPFYVGSNDHIFIRLDQRTANYSCMYEVRVNLPD